MLVRPALSKEVAQYDKRLLGYTASMSFNYAQLCVTADPSSLLSVTFDIDGETKQIEDVATAIIHKKEEEGDNVTIDVFPNTFYYIPAIVQGILLQHPEFKISVEDMRELPGCEDMKALSPETLSIEEEESSATDADSSSDDDMNEEMELQSKYVRLVMPDVNKDRRDLLLNLVKGYRDGLTVQFEAMRVKAKAELADKVVSLQPYGGVPKEEVDAANDMLEKTYDYYIDMADKLTEEKKNQIEDAYQEHIKRHPEDAVNKVLEQPVAQGETTAPAAKEETQAPEQPEEPFSNQKIKIDW